MSRVLFPNHQITRMGYPPPTPACTPLRGVWRKDSGQVQADAAIPYPRGLGYTVKIPAIGIDFGTTNSSIARVTDSGEVELARFPYQGGRTESFRSLLYLESQADNGRRTIASWTGPEGIERYLAADPKGRLIQSLKSY